jgi:DNA-binding IscR family transcriptional regulator
MNPIRGHHLSPCERAVLAFYKAQEAQEPVSGAALAERIGYRPSFAMEARAWLVRAGYLRVAGKTRHGGLIVEVLR